MTHCNEHSRGGPIGAYAHCDDLSEMPPDAVVWCKRCGLAYVEFIDSGKVREAEEGKEGDA